LRWFVFAFVLAGWVMAQQATTLARIEAHPNAYAGREVVLVAYLWSWFDPDVPAVCEGLPAAAGNRMRTRSDGSFCDGTRVAYLPPGQGVKVFGVIDEGRAVQLVARVRVGPEGWWLEPLSLR
jgi:hypothetical protein